MNMLFSLALLVSQNEPQPVIQRPPRHNTVDAVRWAAVALAEYKPERRKFIRFVYVPEWADKEWIGAMNFAVNAAASQVRTIHVADIHAGGWLLAYDLSRLATKEKLVRLVEVWDGLAVDDPYFHVPSVNVDSAPSVGLAILAPHLEEAAAVNLTNPGADKRLDVRR